MGWIKRIFGSSDSIENDPLYGWGIEEPTIPISKGVPERAVNYQTKEAFEAYLGDLHSWIWDLVWTTYTGMDFEDTTRTFKTIVGDITVTFKHVSKQYGDTRLSIFMDYYGQKVVSTSPVVTMREGNIRPFTYKDTPQIRELVYKTLEAIRLRKEREMSYKNKENQRKEDGLIKVMLQEVNKYV